MRIRDRRLAQELKRMQKLRQESSLIDFLPKGDPPDEYLIIYSCWGMRYQDERSNEHLARIYLRSDYPRTPPQITFLTPIFHPNIIAPIQLKYVQKDFMEALEAAREHNVEKEVLKKWLGNQDLFHARICLDILQLNWSPAITLDLVCLELGEMIQYKRYNPDHAFNHEAGDWAKNNQHILPIDTQNLRDLTELDTIRILSVTSMDDQEKVQINILS